MLQEDHRRRVARLLRGERRVSDLERLFSDLRLLKPGRASVQEIGHFAAHRNERDTGTSLKRAQDIQTSAKLWHRQADGERPNVEELKEAARANFNIMPEARLRDRLGISRQTAVQSFAKAIKKYEAGRPLKSRELELVKMFGFSMMWQFAFDARTLFSDFADLLVLDGALDEADRAGFQATALFVALYALSIMHGARLKMVDGSMTRLRLASSDSGDLRIKADIPIADTPKPVVASVPLFETLLNAEAFCDAKILTLFEDLVPAEIEGDRLVALV